MRWTRFLFLFAAVTLLAAAALAEPPGVRYTIRSARSGAWSDARTWAEGRLPGAGDVVQVRAGHTVRYDVVSDQALSTPSGAADTDEINSSLPSAA